MLILVTSSIQNVQPKHWNAIQQVQHEQRMKKPQESLDKTNLQQVYITTDHEIGRY
jgi:hypothetical protein